MLALLLLMVATVFITIWWIQRPIKPVVLSAPEKAVVEEKLLEHSGLFNVFATRRSPVVLDRDLVTNGPSARHLRECVCASAV